MFNIQAISRARAEAKARQRRQSLAEKIDFLLVNDDEDDDAMR